MILVKVVLILILVNALVADFTPSYSKANSDFTSDLSSRLTKDKPNENVIVSPASIHTCLTMTYFGAKGKTATEMFKGLHLTTTDKNVIAERAKTNSESLSPLIKIANRIYVDKNLSIKPTLNSVLRESFKSEAVNLNFSDNTESANKINKWVEDNTNGKIKDLVTPTTVNDAVIILVNAIHFKSSWSSKFDFTTTVDFWLNDNEKTEVNMMHQTEYFNYFDFDELDALGIELPYAKSNFSMLILLPNKRSGLGNLENKLADEDFMEISSEMERTRINLKMPRFETEFEINLNNLLEEMGMKTMFTSYADFSDLIEGVGDIKISEVAHKAFVKVDENGSEAAAATYVKGVSYSRPRPPPNTPIDFNVDHPFIFAIKDKTAIYFVGHIIRP